MRTALRTTRQRAGGDPTRVGGYRIVRRIGAGGMGTVFLALDRRHRPVALKLLHEHLRDDPMFRHRFAGEVAAAARVAGAGTARVLDADPRARMPYLVTEYVDGMSLHDQVTRGGPLPAPETRGLAVGVAAALAAIHDAGVVHRDLKPRNVMLSPTGPVVIDFGIAGAAVQTTTPQASFGTPGWLAPEQLTGRAGGPPADVYAWGLLVLWAATGRHPLHHAPRDGAPDLTGVPAGLVPAVRAALAPDPARRPTARSLVAALREPAYRVVGRSALPIPPTRVLGRSVAVAGRRRRDLLRPVVAVAALVALIAGGWQLASRQRSAGDVTPGNAAQPTEPGPGTGGRAAKPAPRPGTAPADPKATGPKAAGPAPTDPATARDGGLAFTLTGLRCGDTDLGNWPVRRHAKGRYCLVGLRVTNIGKHTGWVFMGSQRLVDGTGEQYPADEWAWIYAPESRAFTGTVDPGRAVSGTLVFDVPPDIRLTRLIVHDSPLSGGAALQLPA